MSEDECQVCHTDIREYKKCPRCDGETARITHVSFDDIYFLNPVNEEWDLGKEKVGAAYSHRYQCMNDVCRWKSW